MTEGGAYEFGAFRFDAGQCVLRRLDNRRLKIKGKDPVPEAVLRPPLCPLLLAFLKAVVENGSHDVALPEEDLIRAAWKEPNKNPGIAKDTLTRTIFKLKRIFRDNDNAPRPRGYITHVANGYKFMLAVKELSGPDDGLEDPAKSDRMAKRAYAWGRHLLDTFTTEKGLHKAIVRFRKAVERVPNYSAALAHESLAHQWLSIYSWRSPEETQPAALRAAEDAVRYGRALGVAYAARAFAALLAGLAEGRGGWREFERLLDKAVGLDRRHGQDFEAVYQIDALRYAARGELDSADAAIEKSLDINPVSFTSNVLKALLLLAKRDYHSCDAALQEIISQESDIDAAYYVRVLACMYKGELRKAYEEIKQGESMAEGNVLYKVLRAYWLVLLGSRDEAVRLLKELDEESRHKYISPYHRALPYVLLNEDEAVERLRRAASEKDAWVLLLNVDPRVDPLRPREKFKELLRELGLDFG